MVQVTMRNLSITILFSPLSAYPLASLLYIRGEDIIRRLDVLRSILDILEGQSRPIHLHHPGLVFDAVVKIRDLVE